MAATENMMRPFPGFSASDRPDRSHLSMRVRKFALAAGVSFVVAGCALGVQEPSRGGQDIPQWHTEAITKLDEDLSSEAYAWQQCTSTEVSGYAKQESRVTIFDPVLDFGVSDTIYLSESDQTQYRLEWRDGKMRSTNAQWMFESRGWGESDSNKESLSIELLRTESEILNLFDFETTTTDLAQPGLEYSLVSEIDSSSERSPSKRIEGLPAGRHAQDIDEEPANYAALSYIRSYEQKVWLLDIWEDNGQTQRLRFQTNDGEREVKELRFVPIAEAYENGELLHPDCGEAFVGNYTWFGFEHWEQTRQIPLRVALDPDGRPYDVANGSDGHAVRKTAGKLTVPNGELEIYDDPWDSSQDDTPSEGLVQITVEPDNVNADDVHTINVDTIWHVDEGEYLAGIWIGPADAKVETWGAFEYAYYSEYDLGAVVAKSVKAETNEYFDYESEEFWNFEGDTAFHDLDTIDGADTLIFYDDYAAGGEHLTRGRDANGDVVAVVIWRREMPWRLGIEQGTPPAEISQVEEQYIECIEGSRFVNPNGSCHMGNFETSETSEPRVIRPR